MSQSKAAARPEGLAMPTPRTSRTRKTAATPQASHPLAEHLKLMTGAAWVKAAAIVLIVVLLCAFFYAVRSVLASLFFAFVVAYVLDPVVDFLEAHGVRRTVTIAAVAVLAVTLILAIPLFFIPNVLGEADHLAHAASAGVRSGALSRLLDTTLDRPSFHRLFETLGWITPEDQHAARAVLAERLGGFVKDNAILMLKRYSAELAHAGFWAGSTAAVAAATVSRTVLGILALVGHLALFAFVTAYLLLGFDHTMASIRELVPHQYRKRLFSIMERIDAQLRAFMRGQLLVCMCLGAMYMIGLWISGVPFGILLGLLGGMASFVPYLGLALTILPALALVLVQHGLDWHVLGVLLTFGLAHPLEGTFITPKIMGEKVGLSPVWIILAIMVFSSLMGFLGLILAVPIAATLKVLIAEAIESYRASSLFTGGAKGTTED
ncbi:MAG: AI-2E family transporter [Candidatus Hydrogenedentes bacterium]|nr:AI-2E family transporter [Candidatus Hydrogenedentota bacterium]